MALGNTPTRRTNLFLEAAKSFAFELQFQNTDGSSLSLATTTVRMVVKQPQRLGGAEVINMISTHDTADDSITRFPLQAADLDLVPGEYPYDITAINEEQYSSPILKGALIIGDNTDEDTTNIYTDVDPSNGALIVIGNGEVVKVVVDYPVGVKGDKGDKGDTGPSFGIFVQPDEPAQEDEPEYTPVWIDTDAVVPDLKAELQAIVAASTDFADFQTRIAAW